MFKKRGRERTLNENYNPPYSFTYLCNSIGSCSFPPIRSELKKRLASELERRRAIILAESLQESVIPLMQSNSVQIKPSC